MRIFAASDLHGNYTRFRQGLIDSNILTHEDKWVDSNNLLVLCGDYIDRGDESKQLVDFLIKLKNNYPECLVLLKGNHEQMLLHGLRGSGPWMNCWINNGGIKAIESYGINAERLQGLAKAGLASVIYELKEVIGSEHFHFFDGLLPYYHHDLTPNERVMFVHAGLNPRGYLQDLNESNEEEDSSHLWIRESFYNNSDTKYLKKRYNADRVVIGHTPTSYITKKYKELMEPVSKHKDKVLAIDTGSNYDFGFITIVEILPDYKHKVIART